MDQVSSFEESKRYEDMVHHGLLDRSRKGYPNSWGIRNSPLRRVDAFRHRLSAGGFDRRQAIRQHGGENGH